MGKKSRAKRLAREGQGPERAHAHSRRRRGGSHWTEQFAFIGLVAVVAIALVFMAKSAFTSASSPAPSSTPAPNMSSMNDSSGGQGIAIGRRVAMTTMAVPASNGEHVALSKYRGKKLVVYFYEGIT